MSPRNSYSREEILQRLQEFARDYGRPPKTNEPGFGKLVEAVKREFGSWDYALKIAGLQTYKEWRKKRTFTAQIRRLLNYNPMTLKQVRNELAKDIESIPKSLLTSPTLLGTTLQNCSNVKSVGPRRSKVYFLDGQEALAQTILDKTSSMVDNGEELLFSYLRKPVTKDQILKLFPAQQRKCEKWLKELILAGLAYRAEFFANARGGQKFGASDLFGNIAGKRYYCRFDCPDEICELILQNIPQQRIDEGNFSAALSRRLKSILPSEIYKIWERKFLFASKTKAKSKNARLDYFV
jgi:hypothetical protein